MNIRRKKDAYFVNIAGMPDPLTVYIKRRVKFSEADVMGIVWHGRYPEYFEEGSAELGRHYGLSYKAFYEAQLGAPIVQLYINYFKPLFLDEEFTIKASIIWNEGSRLNTEYSLINEGGNIAASGYTVQMFIDAISGEVLIASPKILEKCRLRWKAGEFS